MTNSPAQNLDFLAGSEVKGHNRPLEHSANLSTVFFSPRGQKTQFQ